MGDVGRSGILKRYLKKVVTIGRIDRSYKKHLQNGCPVLKRGGGERKCCHRQDQEKKIKVGLNNWGPFETIEGSPLGGLQGGIIEWGLASNPLEVSATVSVVKRRNCKEIFRFRWRVPNPAHLSALGFKGKGAQKVTLNGKETRALGLLE